MSSVPTADNRGFLNLQLSAQALWFHLALRADEEGGRLSVSETEAATVRREIGATADDVRALLRNGFIESRSGRVYITEESVWMPGPVVEENGEQQVLCVYPGSRIVYWQESLVKYRRQQAAEEQRRAERYGRAACFG